MPEQFIDAILKYLADRDYTPLKPRQLARVMGVTEDDYGSFRQAIKQLRDTGRVMLGAKDALMLPEMPSRIVGFFRLNPRGFGFVIPDTPNSHGDLFIPPDATGGAMTGDQVVARVVSRGKRDGREIFGGKIVEILARGQNRFVGTLEQTKGTWFVLPDGKQMTTPIVIRDVGTAGPKAGAKVVAEILQYGKGGGDLPSGVIVETLGEKGRLEVETLGVIRAHGLEDQFSAEALADARKSIEDFDAYDMAGRTDLTGETIVTIDPPDARDFDDAISLVAHEDGTWTLGVHIADVSHFVVEGTVLDTEARRRSTSVYFPRKVVPMLPEVLSNGVCSLQEGQRRYCKSAFIGYDAKGNVTRRRYAETVIASAKRLTYIEAQGILDGQAGGFAPEVVELVQNMGKLAPLIEARRRKAGMLHLDLPEVELMFDQNNKVIDAVPEDQSYTHTVIEMFMVEANEAAAEMLDHADRKFLRRIHPAPDDVGGRNLSGFINACGHKIDPKPSARDLQDLLAAVKGRPESYAVNLAVLKTFEQAEYSPMKIGHFALASRNYCHFTSPIRRYPDLTVHRLFAEYCRGTLASRPPEDLSALVQLGDGCSAAERRAQAAERELREVLVLEFLQTKVGEKFQGVITGMTNFGLFVQSPRFLIDGLLRLEDLGDDWWEVSAKTGEVRGQYSGRKYRMGDMIGVQIASVDIARRQLNLAADLSAVQQSRRPAKQGKPGKPGPKKPKTHGKGHAKAQKGSHKRPKKKGKR